MIELTIQSQPDDESCGPTCLQAVYQYFGLESELTDIIKVVDRSISGGTLSPMLGKHALQQGFKSNIYIYNWILFDPSWFQKGLVDNAFLMEKLELQMCYKNDPYITQSSLAFIEFLKLGGTVSTQPLTIKLFQKYFKQNIPIITGLSATHLYWSPREFFTPEGRAVYDDVRGTPCGHFVILCGYDTKRRHVVISDPHAENPLFHNNYYKVDIHRLINAIMLGVITNDGNLLIIEPDNSLIK